ncbi:signal peptidase II [Paenibacillus turpanensis]|uniref:signal peptidase II n=1 Tax=Paenibacillus turpanensis TaxID=2689078 RepID=UPI00140C65C9|nr:signal peptidase II [Paenibacillus turpanensis]
MVFFYFIIAAVAIAVDQFSKWLIVKNLELYETHSVIGTFFSITSSRNKGAAFGILQNQRWFFIVITIVVIAGVIWYMLKAAKERKHLLLTGLALLLGGAIGNFIDRARMGEVVDFLQFHFKFSFLGYPVDYIFPIFNIADSCIVIGVGLLLIDSLLAWREERKAAGNQNIEREEL